MQPVRQAASHRGVARTVFAKAAIRRLLGKGASGADTTNPVRAHRVDKKRLGPPLNYTKVRAMYQLTVVEDSL